MIYFENVDELLLLENSGCLFRKIEEVKAFITDIGGMSAFASNFTLENNILNIKLSISLPWISEESTGQSLPEQAHNLYE